MEEYSVRSHFLCVHHSQEENLMNKRLEIQVCL